MSGKNSSPDGTDKAVTIKTSGNVVVTFTNPSISPSHPNAGQPMVAVAKPRIDTPGGSAQGTVSGVIVSNPA